MPSPPPPSSVAILITGGGGYLGYHIALDLVKKRDLSTAGGEPLVATKVILYDLVEPLSVWTAAYRAKHGDDAFRDADIVFVQGDIADYKALR